MSSDYKKKREFPHVYFMLFMLILGFSILTYIIPAGEYTRVTGPGGRMMVDPESFRYVESNPTSIFDFFKAIHNGFVSAASVVALVFIIGGSVGVLRKIGVLESSVGALAQKLQNKGIIVIPILMIFFGLMGSFIGLIDLMMVFTPIILPLCLSLGFDRMTAIAITACGFGGGMSGGMANPFTIGVAQQIAGLPLYSGFGFRTICFVLVMAVGIIYVMRYAAKVRKDPTTSFVYDVNEKNINVTSAVDTKALTKRQIAGGIVYLGIFLFMIVGVFLWGWGGNFSDLSAMFIAMAVFSGIAAGLSPNDIVGGFLEGLQDMLLGAFVVGISKAITVVMQDGMIMDTIIHGLAAVLTDLPNELTAMGMVIAQSLINFVVPSGSGQALLTMPILTPIADITGITRQTAILALQFGDGLSNIFYPTVGYFMATLAMIKVPYQKWIKFFLPLFLIWTVMALILCAIAQSINFGPA